MYYCVVKLDLVQKLNVNANKEEEKKMKKQLMSIEVRNSKKILQEKIFRLTKFNQTTNLEQNPDLKAHNSFY